MFTCTLVRSHPEGKRCWVKLEPLSLTAINSITGSGVATRCMHAEGARAGFSIHTEGGHEGRTREVPQEDRCSCTLTSVYILFCNCNIRALATYVPSYDQQLLSLYVYKFVTVLLQVFIFRRLKINHDTHEFVLDSGTVTNYPCGE
jgi:hypothetical protein